MDIPVKVISASWVHVLPSPEDRLWAQLQGPTLKLGVAKSHNGLGTTY